MSIYACNMMIGVNMDIDEMAMIKLRDRYCEALCIFCVIDWRVYMAISLARWQHGGGE